MIPVLVESSVRAALVAVGVAAAIGGLRIRDARARHAAWAAVVAAMMLLPAFCAWGVKAAVRVPASVHYPGPAPVPAAYDAYSAYVVEVAASAPAPAAPVRWRPDPLLAVYLAMAAILLLRLGVGAARVAAIRGRARPEGEFLTSRECVCPITVGWWRPTILLPATWNEWPQAELAAVLAHEREHVRRRDPLMKWMAAVNRCVFWFHPLAWWLERQLSALSEEACDAAAVASGHEPRDYAGYLIHQARTVEQSGRRMVLAGAPMGQGSLARRIGLLLESEPARALGRGRAVAGGALCIFAIAVFAGCKLERVEKPLPGQPTMNQLAHRRAESNRQYQERQKKMLEHARSMTPQEAEQLIEHLQQKPEDTDRYSLLVRHYEFTGDVKRLDAIKLWYIEHRPDTNLWLNIDPHLDRAGYEKGKALWLAYLKKPGANPETYRRAADFLEGGDKRLAGSALMEARKRWPQDPQWTSAMGRHYAQVLLGAAEPLTEYNVVRKVSAAEADSAYAREVRAELAATKDAQLLAQTSQYLGRMGWGENRDSQSLALAISYAGRALALDPGNRLAQREKQDFENMVKLQELRRMSPARLAAAPPGDRMRLALFQMQDAAMRERFGAAEEDARELLGIAGQNRNEPLSGEVMFDANIVLGKAALHHGDKKAAVRYLMAAAEAPGSERVRRGEFEMNLPRALVDWGERRAVVDFFRKMAPKTDRSAQFLKWADELSRGINPDLFPTFSAPNCTNDPC